jgi:hypothetical protein
MTNVRAEPSVFRRARARAGVLLELRGRSPCLLCGWRLRARCHSSPPPTGTSVTYVQESGFQPVSPASFAVGGTPTGHERLADGTERWGCPLGTKRGGHLFRSAHRQPVRRRKPLLDQRPQSQPMVFWDRLGLRAVRASNLARLGRGRPGLPANPGRVSAFRPGRAFHERAITTGRDQHRLGRSAALRFRTD